MKPMEITAEEYAKYFEPAPSYLLVQRLPINFERIGTIYVPDQVRDVQVRFIGIGKVLRVSDLESDDEYVEYLKNVFLERKYVCFEFHVVAEIKLPPQFVLPKDVNLILLHTKDVVQIPSNLDELFEKHKEFEKNQPDLVVPVPRLVI